jgi:hypothetical protein
MHAANLSLLWVASQYATRALPEASSAMELNCPTLSPGSLTPPRQPCVSPPIVPCAGTPSTMVQSTDMAVAFQRPRTRSP